MMIIDGLPGGGAEKVVLTLAEGWVALGHRVTVVSLRPVCDYSIPAGVEYQVVADRCETPWRKLTEHTRRAARLDKYIMQSEAQGGEYDLIFSHLHKTDRIVSKCRNLNFARTWFCLHGVFSASYLAHKPGWKRWLKKQKIRRVYQNRQLIAVSQYLLDDVINNVGVRPSRARIISNPFDFEHILQLAAEPCPLAGTDYLLHVGRFHEAKRHDRLLEAYAQSGISAPLVLLGQGSEQQETRLRELAQKLDIADRVRFEGFHRNPYSWMRHARLLILSSDSEGFGNVLVEALICHTPVVSTRCPGGPAAILTGDLARGLAEMDAASLGDRIREIYHHPPDLQQLNLNAYSNTTVCQQYLQLAESAGTHSAVAP